MRTLNTYIQKDASSRVSNKVDTPEPNFLGYPEYDIYVRNTGSHPLYFSVPLTEKSKLYLAENEELRGDLYDRLISNNVYKSIEPNSGWVKVFSYNKEMCQLLDKLISEKWETKLKENSKKLNHSSLNDYAKVAFDIFKVKSNIS